MWHEGGEIVGVSRGQLRPGEDGGGGDEAVEFKSPGSPHGIEKARCLAAMGISEGKNAAGEQLAHEKCAFHGNGAALKLPPSQAGDGGLRAGCHETHRRRTVWISRISQCNEQIRVEMDHGRVAKSSRVWRSSCLQCSPSAAVTKL